MKAMVLTAKDTPFQLMDVPDPVAGPGEAVAKVYTCGSGLTIQHSRAGRFNLQYPRIIGHEITGEIVEVGEGVTDLKIGDGLTAYYYFSCGKCKWCKADRETLCDNLKGNVGRDCDGGYAEYMKLPADMFMKYPEGLDWKKHPAECGVLTDAIATPVKVIRRARIEPGHDVAVIGAGGGLGIQMIIVAKWAGARVIAVDVRPEKFETCKKVGADETVDASSVDVTEALKELTGGYGVDAAIDFAGTKSSMETALAGLNKAGRLVILGGAASGIEIPGKLIKSEREVMGSKYATRGEVRHALELAAKGEVWPLVNEIHPLEAAEELHQRLEQGLVTGRAALKICD
jgi:propanol-preferring alcohol dehydrogenase